MRVFICWSGDLSKTIAQRFYEYLELSPLHIDVLFSPEGISSGERWPSWLDKTLEQSSYGWLFMTKENLESKWIHFEAGNLSKDANTSRVCPILIDVTDADLRPPLSQFTARPCTKDGMFKAVSDLNVALGSDAVRDDVLRMSFEKEWPEVETFLDRSKQASSPFDAQIERSERDILLEILAVVREGARPDGPDPGEMQFRRLIFDLTTALDRLDSKLGRVIGPDSSNFAYLGLSPASFEKGDKVFHSKYRQGIIAEMLDDGQFALVSFDNPTFSMKEPKKVAVNLLRMGW